MYVEIDGQSFAVESAEHAKALFDRARALARESAPEQAEAKLRTHLMRTPKLRPKIERPKVTSSSPELQALVKQTRATLANIYSTAYRDAEIKLRLAGIFAEEDEDDLLFLL